MDSSRRATACSGLALHADVGRGRSRRAWHLAVLAAIVLGHGAVGHAQSLSLTLNDSAQRAPVRRPANRVPQPLGFRAYLIYGRDLLAARKTFDAVVGTSRVNGLGGGAEILNVWHGAFVRVNGSTWSRTGARVDASGTSLGISTTVKMTPIEIGGGWRTGGGAPKASSGVALYAGGGLVRMR